MNREQKKLLEQLADTDLTNADETKIIEKYL